MLPKDILRLVFLNLDNKDLLNCFIVCKKWYSLSCDRYFWNAKLRKEFEPEYIDTHLITKKIYKRQDYSFINAIEIESNHQGIADPIDEYFALFSQSYNIPIAFPFQKFPYYLYTENSLKYFTKTVVRRGLYALIDLQKCHHDIVFKNTYTELKIYHHEHGYKYTTIYTMSLDSEVKHLKYDTVIVYKGTNLTDKFIPLLNLNDSFEPVYKVFINTFYKKTLHLNATHNHTIDSIKSIYSIIYNAGTVYEVHIFCNLLIDVIWPEIIYALKHINIVNWKENIDYILPYLIIIIKASEVLNYNSPKPYICFKPEYKTQFKKAGFINIFNYKDAVLIINYLYENKLTLTDILTNN